MRFIYINKDAMDAIRSMALDGLVETGVKQPNGLWKVPVDQEVYNEIQKIRQHGESESDCILRLVAFRRGGGSFN